MTTRAPAVLKNTKTTGRHNYSLHNKSLRTGWSWTLDREKIIFDAIVIVGTKWNQGERNSLSWKKMSEQKSQGRSTICPLAQIHLSSDQFVTVPVIFHQIIIPTFLRNVADNISDKISFVTWSYCKRLAILDPKINPAFLPFLKMLILNPSRKNWR